jgi:hypothetical protein
MGDLSAAAWSVTQKKVAAHINTHTHTHTHTHIYIYIYIYIYILHKGTR